MMEKRFDEITENLHDRLLPLLHQWLEDKNVILLLNTYYSQSAGWEIGVNVKGYRLTSNPFSIRVGRNGWVKWSWLIELDINGFRRVVRSPFYPLVRKFSSTKKPARIPIKYLPRLGLFAVLLYKLVDDLKSIDFLRVSLEDKLSPDELRVYARYLSGNSERVVVGIKSDRIFPSDNRYLRLVYYPVEGKTEARWGTKDEPVVYSRSVYTYKDILSFVDSIIKTIEINEV